MGFKVMSVDFNQATKLSKMPIKLEEYLQKLYEKALKS